MFATAKSFPRVNFPLAAVSLAAAALTFNDLGITRLSHQLLVFIAFALLGLCSKAMMLLTLKSGGFRFRGDEGFSVGRAIFLLVGSGVMAVVAMYPIFTQYAELAPVP